MILNRMGLTPSVSPHGTLILSLTSDIKKKTHTNTSYTPPENSHNLINCSEFVSIRTGRLWNLKWDGKKKFNGPDLCPTGTKTKSLQIGHSKTPISTTYMVHCTGNRFRLEKWVAFPDGCCPKVFFISIFSVCPTCSKKKTNIGYFSCLPCVGRPCGHVGRDGFLRR